MCINEKDINRVLQAFNTYNKKFQFTHEIEVNKQLSLLDVLLIREHYQIITDWY